MELGDMSGGAICDDRAWSRAACWLVRSRVLRRLAPAEAALSFRIRLVPMTSLALACRLAPERPWPPRHAGCCTPGRCVLRVGHTGRYVCHTTAG